MSASKNIRFFFLKKSITLRNRTRLKNFLNKIFRSEKSRLKSLNIIFCSDNYLLKINSKYLKHNYYTDTVSFNLAEKGAPVEGEIYISVDRIRDNAKRLGLSYQQEIHRVIFHSVLHLCGFRDKNPHERSEINSAENKYLSLYFI